MKKTIFALIMLSIAMIGCKKVDIQSDEKGNLKSSDLAYGIDITLPDLNQNVDQLVLNPDDAQDE